ncbi:hypothetical protein DFH11DRAFT_1648517 [Phellopilus nigrolimitatus]|nr:hypothetical protein DFH11DRAFT_1648517 [Phellopilus nigrolimitatus]
MFSYILFSLLSVSFRPFVSLIPVLTVCLILHQRCLFYSHCLHPALNTCTQQHDHILPTALRLPRGFLINCERVWMA